MKIGSHEGKLNVDESNNNMEPTGTKGKQGLLKLGLS